MKVLFDQNVPHGLRLHLTGHTVEVANEIGSAGLANGELTKAAEAVGFEVLVTADQNIVYQQDNIKRSISLVVLNTNQLQQISERIQLVVDAVDKSTKSSYLFLHFGPFKIKAQQGG